MKGITKTAHNEPKSQRGGFLSMLMGTLGASLLGDILSKGLFGKGLSSGKGIYRSGQGIKKKSLMPPHPLTNFEIMNYFKNEPRFNGVFSRNNLPKTIKKGAYVINIDEYKNIGTHWVVLFLRELHSKSNLNLWQFWCRTHEEIY